MAFRLSTVGLPARDRLATTPRFVVIATILLLVAGASVLFQSRLFHRDGTFQFVPAPANPAIEEQWGIRISQLTVDADGGLVDLRYQIIDPNKALPIVEDPTKRPEIIAEDNGIDIKSALLMPPKHDLVAGRTYFILYGNVRGAVKRGRPVTIVVGDHRIEHLIAQ